MIKCSVCGGDAPNSSDGMCNTCSENYWSRQSENRANSRRHKHEGCSVCGSEYMCNCNTNGYKPYPGAVNKTKGVRYGSWSFWTLEALSDDEPHTVAYIRNTTGMNSMNSMYHDRASYYFGNVVAPRLVNGGLIVKVSRGTYQITVKGHRALQSEYQRVKGRTDIDMHGRKIRR